MNPRTKKDNKMFSMKSVKILIVLFGIFFFACQKKMERKPAYNATQYVDTQLGSVGARWFFYTPASLPFGLAKLAPHTDAYMSEGWIPGGYDDRHTSIEGFGHFHEFQIGGVVVMPTTGELKTIPGTLENPDSGYRSRFAKEDEHTEPGYYSVLLQDYGIKAELTATERVGFHRYTFPKSDEAKLIFDIGHLQGESGEVTDAFAQLVNGNEVEGFLETNPNFVKLCDSGNRVRMFFVAKISKTPESFGIFTDSLKQENVPETRGTRNGIYLDFKTAAGEVVEMQVGLSYTSIDNARLNLETETASVSFDEAKSQAREKWNEMLSRIRIEDESEENKTKFYTGLYHALLGRGLASDVNGQYRMNNGAISPIPPDENNWPKYKHFNTDGMWGGFWNLSQLWSLVYPEQMSLYVQSNITFYKETGWLHDGVAAGTFTNGVCTNFQGLLIAATYNCGIRDFEVETGYEAAFKNEVDSIGRNTGNGKYDLNRFIKLGYVPYENHKYTDDWLENFGGSHTLEYAYSSYAVAQMAKSLGKTDDYKKLMKQAGYWKNLFDPETLVFRPKLPNGEFIKDFDPMRPWDGFQEGNAFQFLWYVPQDVDGLIQSMGKELFNQRLDKMFTLAQKNHFSGNPDHVDGFSGIEEKYNHGNQPGLHTSWLFNYSGQPWLTQKWTRTICNEFYGLEPFHGYGIGQDEDQGQLGSWYVMAALGLFDVQGHASMHPTMQFGSPLFNKVIIDLNPNYYSGKELVIEAKNNAPNNLYIQSANFNGSSIKNSWMYRNEIVKGGTLSFTMGPEPNKKWGIEQIPPSMSNEKK
jgi:predicted alpha-1,2-mannosidase